MTVVNARRERPELPWRSLGVTPPHVTDIAGYQATLQSAGADRILEATSQLSDLPLNQL